MKKSIWVMVLAVLVMGASLVSAEEMKGGMMGEGMMEKGMMGKGMMCSMMKSMTDKSVVATSDGGIVVLSGNTLTKFDKDLNVVKEVELKMDMEGMHKNMKEMMKMCPMMNKGMGNMDKDAGAKSDSSAPADEVDHASHH